MLSEPKIEFREAQPYMAIRKTVKMEDLPMVLPPLIPKVLNWVKANDLVPCAPFFHYLSLDKDMNLVADVAVPVDRIAAGTDEIVNRILPAGRYAIILYTGPYENLLQPHLALEKFLKEQNINETVMEGDKRVFGGRTEFYITDPEVEKDPDKWETLVAFYLGE